jgi:S-adenosylmethionine/arginine decarboxylase-like enzyme
LQGYHYFIFDLRVRDIPSPEGAEAWLREVCDGYGFDVKGILKTVFKSPVPGPAYTLVAVLASSHAVIHTAPEEDWVEVVFACCRFVPIEDLAGKVRAYFAPESARLTSFVANVPGRRIF